MNQVIIRKKQENAPVSEYEFGQAFVSQLVSEHKDKVNELLKKYGSSDLQFVSTEKKKEALKKLMKEQNQPFVLELSKYIADTANTRVSISPALSRVSAPMMQLKTTVYNNTGGAYWSLGGEKYQEALNWLKKQGYSEAEAESILTDKGENAPELSAWNEGKDKINWNKALDTTGKVAQSIFYLGSIFSKKEDPAPTMTDAENNTKSTKTNLTRNIIVAVVIIAVLATTAYFVFRKKGK